MKKGIKGLSIIGLTFVWGIRATLVLIMELEHIIPHF
jgi:hypothetical protein